MSTSSIFCHSDIHIYYCGFDTKDKFDAKINPIERRFDSIGFLSELKYFKYLFSNEVNLREKKYILNINIFYSKFLLGFRFFL